jgi:DinB superfamily
MNQQQITIKMAIDAWNMYVTRADKLFDLLSDEQLNEQVASGRNTGIYLLGHLTAVHDGLFRLLLSGEKLYPALEEVFIRNPDKSGIEKPAIKDLRNYWSRVNNKLSERFNRFTADDGFESIMPSVMKILIKNPIEINSTYCLIEQATLLTTSGNWHF